MKILKDNSDKESFLNEFKGNIFEFLTAKNLATLVGREEDFLNDIDPELKNRLTYYEKMLRELDLNLFHALPKYASETAGQLYERLLQEEFLKEGEPFKSYIVGKKISSRYGIRGPWKEVDIVLVPDEQDKKVIPIGLKLSKMGAYVNTKSGGLFSFYTQYFANFNQTPEYQKQLKDLALSGFKKISHKLCEMRGIFPPEENFKESWRLYGYPELPGKLKQEERAILHKHYHELAQMMKFHLESFERFDVHQFEKSLAPIMGLGRSDIIQCICFTGPQKITPWIMTTKKDWFYEKGVWREKDTTSSFEREYPSASLQFRIKPMNKFTTVAYKINCSVKLKGEL